MIDIEEASDAVELFVHEPGRKLLVASTSGHGFIVPEDEVLAMTRKGKQVLNVRPGSEAAVCAPADRRQRRGDRRQPQAPAVPAEELPEMPRGKGVRLQRYKDGGLADAKTFTKKDGPHLHRLGDAELHLSSAELQGLVGRARAGRPPAAEGLPQVERFGPRFLG